jgi:hypothetical protein
MFIYVQLFLVSDIIQFTELIHAAQGSRIVNQLPNELGNTAAIHCLRFIW